MEADSMDNKTILQQDDCITGTFSLEVKRTDGTVERVEKPMESFTQRLWEVLLSGATDQWDIDVDMPYRAYNSGSQTITFQEIDAVRNAGINGNYGILVGTGSSAVALDDYSLDFEVPTAELERSQMGGEFSRTNREATYFRSFENVSGGNITVSEMGLAGTQNSSQSFGNIFLLTRDVFSSITLADGDILSVSITLEWSQFQENFGAYFWKLYAEELGFTLLDTDGGNSSINIISGVNDIFDYNHPEEDEVGVVVGTGDAVHGANQRNLNSRITGGTGAGQLAHGPNRVKRAYNDGTKSYMEIYRSFTNLSGGDITIREISWQNGPSLSQNRMWWAKVLPSPITLSDGETHIFKLLFTTSL